MISFPVCLPGLLSGSSKGALPNVFLEELFFSKKQRSQNCFGEATNSSKHGFGSFRGAP
jgi:hypothetical protein